MPAHILFRRKRAGLLRAPVLALLVLFAQPGMSQTAADLVGSSGCAAAVRESTRLIIPLTAENQALARTPPDYAAAADAAGRYADGIVAVHSALSKSVAAMGFEAAEQCYVSQMTALARADRSVSEEERDGVIAILPLFMDAEFLSGVRDDFLERKRAFLVLASKQ